MDEDLEQLRCPKGCDPRFTQYLYWEGSSTKIVGTVQVYNGEINALETFFDLGLRCGDCGTQYGKRGVTKDTKVALDALLESVFHDLSDLADQTDTELLQERLRRIALLMEDPEP